MDALTKTPATLIGVYDKVGSIDAGKLANFIITTGPVFEDSTIFLQNWIQGKNFMLLIMAGTIIAAITNSPSKQTNQTKAI